MKLNTAYKCFFLKTKQKIILGAAGSLHMLNL